MQQYESDADFLFCTFLGTIMGSLDGERVLGLFVVLD